MPNNQPTLTDALLSLAKSDFLPMHMPGHKRNATLAPSALPYALDITEIDGFDNLHHPHGLLLDLSKRAAQLYGAYASFPLTCGSTCGILAAIRGMVHPGGRVLVARNCHLSVFHALALAGAEPIWLMPAVDKQTGIAAGMDARTVSEALARYPNTELVILTSPTYEGKVSEVAEIASAVHAAGARLFVDAAHGAHLGFSEAFPPSAMQEGADAAVVSLHKTLPAMTSCALALAADADTAAEIAEQLDVFQTSSPSYVLLASIDVCVHLLETKREELFAAWNARLERFRRAAAAWNHLRLYKVEDPSKLVICTDGLHRSGKQVASVLRTTYRIETEAAWTHHLIAMTGPGDTDAGIERLCTALAEIDCDVGSESIEDPLLFGMPQTVVPLAVAERAAREAVPLADSIGRVCAGYVVPYPPGIPLLLPGERICRETVSTIVGAMAMGDVMNTGDGLPETVFVIKENTGG